MCFSHPAASMFAKNSHRQSTVGTNVLGILESPHKIFPKPFSLSNHLARVATKHTKEWEKTTKEVILGPQISNQLPTSRSDSMASHGPQGVSWIWIAGSALPCQVWCRMKSSESSTIMGIQGFPPPQMPPKDTQRDNDGTVVSNLSKKGLHFCGGKGVGIGDWALSFRLQVWRTYRPCGPRQWSLLELDLPGLFKPWDGLVQYDLNEYNSLIIWYLESIPFHWKILSPKALLVKLRHLPLRISPESKA